MIYIIIPVHNRKHFTKDCIISLKKQTYKEFKIVVIDDGSTDGTVKMLLNEFPEVHVITGDGNLWWTAATNLGVKYALENNADYVLTLNNDTIAYSDFLEKMVFWTNKIPNALLGSMAIDQKTKKIVYGGERINWVRGKFVNLLNEQKSEDGIIEVSHLPGRGLLIPKSVFNKIGLFDYRSFPHYMADYDYTMTARKNGFLLFCNYDSKLFIFPDESGDRKNRDEISLSNYINHLFGLKGGGNLRNISLFTLRHCPFILIPSFLFISMWKRILGYWKIF